MTGTATQPQIVTSGVNKKMPNADSVHVTVLLKETVDGLNLKEGAVILDATINSAGHSVEVCKRLGGKARIIGLDADAEGLARAKKNLEKTPCEYSLVLTNFRNLDDALIGLRVREVDGIILDLGLSSDQLETSGRGFSFQKDEPLLMTFSANPDGSLVTAYDIANRWQEENIASIVKGFGEERFAGRIAKAIVRAREKGPISGSKQLAEIVKMAIPAIARRGKTHPATKTFQAIRIAVNDELGALNDVLRKGFSVLKSGGRMSVISFHSLEDRVVKRFVQNKVTDGEAVAITKKPIIPSEEEISVNPRARSAKLRVFEKK